MSAPDKANQIKQKDTNTSFLETSQFDPVLDNLRVTKQERDLLNFLLPSNPASFPERRVERFNSRTKSAQTKCLHQPRITKKKKSLAYPCASPATPETPETPATVDSPPRAFGVLIDIADIDQAWKSWAGTS